MYISTVQFHFNAMPVVYRNRLLNIRTDCVI